MHFFNPAPLMKLVEIIPGQRTRPEVSARLAELALAMGKEPIEVADSPGFIVNRVARSYYLESLRLLEEGAVSVEGLDRLMRGLGFAMGPFELMDLIGVDTNHAVSASMYEHFFQEERFRPSRIQQQMCDAGFKGRKSGQGFYPYPPSGAAQ
jgi:3-hydroxybutyryl-CoA dehydrogenase